MVMEKLIKLIGLLVNTSHHPDDGSEPFPTSSYLLFKAMQVSRTDELQRTVYICPKVWKNDVSIEIDDTCGFRLTTETPNLLRCEACKSTWELMFLLNQESYHVTIPIKWVIQKMMDKYGQYVSMSDFVATAGDFMDDVFHGQRYKDMKMEENDLSVVVYADAGALFQSTNRSLYAVMIQVLNLPLRQRNNDWFPVIIWAGNKCKNFSISWHLIEKFLR